MKTNRDTLIFKLPNDGALVVGCDSAGGIGPKRLDKIKVNAFTLGKFTARAALMDVLAVGAHPTCIVDTLAVEPEPTGNEILRGIRAEAAKAGLDPKRAVTGSTEKNIKVDQTGIGVTVIGTCQYKHLKIGSSKPNDIVAALGVPCVGGCGTRDLLWWVARGAFVQCALGARVRGISDRAWIDPDALLVVSPHRESILP